MVKKPVFGEVKLAAFVTGFGFMVWAWTLEPSWYRGVLLLLSGV